MKPNGGGGPSGDIGKKIASDFGSHQAFVRQFKDTAVTQFGSGWAQLTLKDGELVIMKTSNADAPLVHSAKPLLTVDIWEYAYYLDYQNRRADTSPPLWSTWSTGIL